MAEMASVVDVAKTLAHDNADELAKYVKLVKLGQPIDHVKARMKADGYDPELLKM